MVYNKKKQAYKCNKFADYQFLAKQIQKGIIKDITDGQGKNKLLRKSKQIFLLEDALINLLANEYFQIKNKILIVLD